MTQPLLNASSHLSDRRISNEKKKSETHADGKLSCSIVMLLYSSDQCNWDLYNGETKHLLRKLMTQHRRGNSSGLVFAVHVHLKEKNHSCEDNNVNIMAREDRWFETGVN